MASGTPTQTLARPIRSHPAAARPVIAGWERPGALLLAALVFSLVQGATANIIGVDGYYHIKVAALIREHGLPLDFPWLRFTILNEAAYTDHHLLFHVLQAPFTVLELRTAAKMAAILFATLGFWGCYLFMAGGGVRWPFAWLVVLLAVAPTFLWRHSMARPQSLALLLLVGALWLIFERRLGWLVPLGFVSAWLFDGFILTFAVPLAALVARFLLTRRLDWRPLAYVALGTALGLVIHPYFPRNLVFAGLHLLPKSGLSGADQVPVGLEWYPYSPWSFFSRVGPSVAVMVLGLVPLALSLRRRERLPVSVLTLTLLGLGFLVMVARSQRMVEYFPGFAVLSAAWSWSLSGRPYVDRALGRLAPWRSPWPAAAGALLAAGWLVANSPPGSLVFNTDWDDFPQLFFWDTHNVYVLGLDATYLSLYDQDLYRLWRGIASGAVPNPSSALRERFGAEYVMTDTLSQHTRFLSVAAEDPGLEEVFRSPAAVVFRVRAAPS